MKENIKSVPALACPGATNNIPRNISMNKGPFVHPNDINWPRSCKVGNCSSPKSNSISVGIGHYISSTPHNRRYD